MQVSRSAVVEDPNMPNAPTSPAVRVTSALRALPFTFRVVGTAPTWAAVWV